MPRNLRCPPIVGYRGVFFVVGPVYGGAGANGRWSISVSGGQTSGATGQAVAVGLLALSIAILLFLVVRVLARSRQRAFALVDERTGELRHQALPDTLTGLPNRALIVDRVDQMLARTHREPLAFGGVMRNSSCRRWNARAISMGFRFSR